MPHYLEKTRTLLEAALKDKIRYYYVGDPIILPNDVTEHGAIIISPTNTEFSVADTGRDDKRLGLTVTVVKDMRQEFNKTPQEVVGTKWLVEIMEGTDDSGNLRTDTVAYVLRSNLDTLGENADLSIRYGIRSGENQAPVAWSAIATISLDDIRRQR